MVKSGEKVCAFGRYKPCSRSLTQFFRGMAFRQRLVLEVDRGSSDTDSSSSDSDEEVQETCPTNEAGEKLTRRLPSAAKASKALGRKTLVNPYGCRKRDVAEIRRS